MKTLLVVDLQNDFLPCGALAVPGGNAVIPYVNSILSGYDLRVATQDWHPANHASFAANHTGKSIGETIELDGLQQILWPVHCVQNSYGAEFSPLLNRSEIDMVFRKGVNPQIDSYSGFYDNGHKAETGLRAYLQSKGVISFDIVGIATDYCVKYTVLDGLSEGFSVRVLVQGCRGVELVDGDSERALDQMQDAGALIVRE